MKGGKEQMLLTSLLDPTKYPANEIIALYHERWEIEIVVPQELGDASTLVFCNRRS
jgi:hypothetical protein